MPFCSSPGVSPVRECVCLWRMCLNKCISITPPFLLTLGMVEKKAFRLGVDLQQIQFLHTLAWAFPASSIHTSFSPDFSLSVKQIIIYKGSIRHLCQHQKPLLKTEDSFRDEHSPSLMYVACTDVCILGSCNKVPLRWWWLLWTELFPPKFMCWNPSPQYLGMWPYLEIRSGCCRCN